ncbi:MAG: hypothetical protein HRT44_05420 [Bdellovibrionales bacterium]|nr:spondin domain-containing protein [Bdellovibrionales bacterium]NQZ18682.1 hypothetical protein [Bdellovibrionales bacterium]
MKKILLMTIVLLGFALQAQAGQQKLFKVTVVNLTKGQPITPPVLTVHAPGYQPVHLGQQASQGLSELATDGVTDTLVQELANEKKVVRTAVGDGVILPGSKAEIMVEANNPYFKVSFVSMLARTNDAIAVAQNISTKLKVGQKVIKLAKVYDAGAELNAESCEHIPAPPCGNPGVSAGEGEGFIRPHEGLLGIADLIAERDAFANKVAKIIVERVQ